MSQSNTPTDDSQDRQEELRSHAQTQKRRQARRGAASDILLRVAFLLLLLAIWQGAHWWMVTRADDTARAALFPSPMQVGSAIADGFRTSRAEVAPGVGWITADYPAAIAVSVKRLIQGYFLSLLLGFPLGLLISRSQLAAKTLGWSALSLQAMPSIGWAPLAILWFGSQSDAPVLAVTVLGSLFATMLAVSDSIGNVPPLLSRAGRTLGASGPRLYFSVLLPAALPAIITGLKVGWSFAWRSLLAAELLVSAGGLGLLLQRDRNAEYAAGLFATIFVIILISLAIQAFLFAPIERRLQSLWGLTGSRS